MPNAERSVVHMPAAEVTTLMISGDRVSYVPGDSDTGAMITTFISTGSGENSADLVTMCTVVPPGEGVRPRAHDNVDEAFYGLDGEVELTAGTDLFLIGPGAYAMVPSGMRYSWRNAGDTPARVIRTCKSAGKENYPFRVAANE